MVRKYFLNLLFIFVFSSQPKDPGNRDFDLNKGGTQRFHDACAICGPNYRIRGRAWIKVTTKSLLKPNN